MQSGVLSDAQAKLRRKVTPPRLRGRRVVMHVLLIVGAVAMVYPILWMLASSFKAENEIFTDPGLWPSASADFDSYIRGWSGTGGYSFTRFFGNSFIVAIGAVFGNILSGSMAAYAFARLRLKMRRLWFAIMLATIMLPYHALLIPQYVLFLNIGWVNSFLPLIVPKLLATDAFFIFLMVQFIRGIPTELDDSARVDGCGYFGIYWRIIMPLATPALVTTGIFTFVWTWDDFLSQLIYLSDTSKYTVTLGLNAFLDARGQSDWGAMFAMSTLSIVPVFLVFLGFQRYLVEGIATTGLKG